VTAYDAYLTARALHDHGISPDEVTTADFDAAADYAGTPRPTSLDERSTIRLALEAVMNH
jgi:hypothetical protein